MDTDLTYYPPTATLIRAEFENSREYRRYYQDYCKHYGFKARVEGGWRFFEFETDYRTWKNQK